MAKFKQSISQYGKSNFVIFHSYQCKLPQEINLKIFDNNSKHLISLKRKTYVKYVGVLIGVSLSWKYHIDYISTKISKGVGIIAWPRHLVPSKIWNGIPPELCGLRKAAFKRKL